MIIRTSQDVALIDCCPCQPAACDEPRKICESQQHTAYCANDDYTDEHDEWERISDAHGTWLVDHYLWTVNHAQWIIDHAVWVEAHAEWVEAHATWETAHDEWEDDYDEWYTDTYMPWLVCMSENPDTPEACGEEPTPPEEPAEPVEPVEPVEPIEPVEPPEAGTEPEPPEGYGDVEHGCFGPFAEPETDPDERIPRIYRTFQNDFDTGDSIVGQYQLYVGGGSGETLDKFTYTGTYEGVTHDASANTIDGEGCHDDSGYDGSSVDAPFFFDLSGIESAGPTYECTETTRTIETISTTTHGTLPLELEGCPGPWGEGEPDEAWDLTNTARTTYILGSPIEPSDLIARAASNANDRYAWPAYPGYFSTYCTALTELLEWPTARDLYVESEAHVAWEVEHAEWETAHEEWVDGGEIGDEPVEPEEPENLHWIGCEEYAESTHELPAEASASARKVRYKVGIPEAWADFAGRHAAWVLEHAEWVTDHAAWVTEHDAWEEEDTETRGDEPVEPIEPVEPVERTVYELQWVEGFFPKEWTDWRAAKDDFDLATTLHELWEECMIITPEECDDEPEVPADPGEEPTRPSIVAERSWTYDAEGDSEFSDWFEMAAPSTEGEVRVVNLLVICYHSTRLGVKPTSHGEVFEFDEPEE